MEKKFTPVIAPDVLCETDVEGGTMFFTMCWIDVDELAVFFDRLVRTVCVFSLPVLPTMIVASTFRVPRDRCGNAGFLSLVATLKKFYPRVLMNWKLV